MNGKVEGGFHILGLTMPEEFCVFEVNIFKFSLISKYYLFLENIVKYEEEESIILAHRDNHC